jgi:hypothetical protein
MYVWIATAAALVAVSFTLRHFLRSQPARTPKIDVGEVSERWVVEHRADRSDN